jgi:hypothetical protein
MMVDLSKELAEIKRDLLENDAVYASCDASSSFEKATRLLSIIETEIPKFIRAYPP